MKNPYRVSKRTASYVVKTLAEIEQAMAIGYTHENFNNISRSLRKISGHLFLEEQKMIEDLWRDVYTNNYDAHMVTECLDMIRCRF